MNRWYQPGVDAWNKLSRRDRRILAAGALAVVLATEAMLVWPLRARRLVVEAAALAERQQKEAARLAQAQALATRMSSLRQAIQAAEVELKQLDHRGTQVEPLAGLMRRAVAGHGLVLQGLRALPAQDVQLASGPGADAAPAAASAPASRVYRHRVELKVGGPGLLLVQGIDGIARQLAPMHVERVQLSAGADGQALATITLFTIGQERTWLAL